MFVRFIDEYTVEEAPKVLRGGGVYIANPRPETLMVRGYKPLEITEPVGDAADGYHWEQRYVELNDKVVKTWVQVENPVQEIVNEPEEVVEEPAEEPIEPTGEEIGDPTPADGGNDSSASSESVDVLTEGGE